MEGIVIKKKNLREISVRGVQVLFLKLIVV